MELDAEALPSTKRELEQFAFNLCLFLELNGEEAVVQDLVRYKDLMKGVGQALRESSSRRAAWLESWIAGDVSIVGDSRYMGRRSDIFQS